MSKRSLFSSMALVAALLGGTAFQANAVVIDFDSDLSYRTTGNPYDEDGFRLVNSNNSTSALLFWGTAPWNADPDGNTLSHNFSGTTMTLTRIDSSIFSFNSIDLADVYNTGSGGDVRFNFVFADSSTSQSTVTINGTVGLETFNFNQSNLIRVSWVPLTTQGPWLQLDNIVVDAGSNNVPEPASLALLGIGLAGLGFVRRRRT